MKIHLSNYDYLRNFDVFLRGLDMSNPEKLEIIISKQRERASIIAKEMDGSRFLSLLEPE